MKAWNKFTLYDQNPNVIHKILSTFSNSKASALRNICNKIIDPAAVVNKYKIKLLLETVLANDTYELGLHYTIKVVYVKLKKNEYNWSV